MTSRTKIKTESKASEFGAAHTTSTTPRRTSKIGQVLALLQRNEGATLDEMTKATSWQPHSARAVLTGLRKKGYAIVKSKRDDATCYRITGQS